MDRSYFEEQMARMYMITGAKTQIELAALLNIKQASIANSKKRQNVPDRWLLRLLCRLNVNPNWILTGKGERYMSAAPPEEPVDALEVIRNMPTRALVRELVKRMEDLEKNAKGTTARQFPD